MAERKGLLRVQKLLGLVGLLLLLQMSSAFAQGSIFGTVQNANLTTPANGEISFYGFTDNTDDEIRLESSVGAGYDAGNWFDDFQNFLSKTPGNPYTYRFYNPTNGQGAVLAKTIPNNSFQQEDITLAAVTWPAAPTGMATRIVSSTSLVLTWTRVAGQTYHVYRRPSTSGGSFFRLDNTAGLLSAPGLADSFFVDNTVSSGGSYDYLLIAQNGSGTLGVHSAIFTVSTGTPVAPSVASISPNSGSGLGGTSVAVHGTGFDMNGATVTIGGAPLTSVTVVSPYQINGVTPAGSGGARDVVVQNTSSTLSATLTGGYTYLANQPPVLAAIGAKSVAEGATLAFGVSATDPDGTTPTLSTSALPLHATFVDSLNGKGSLVFNPDYTQAGTYNVTFRASDGTLLDSEIVVITVTNTNQPPVLAAIGPKSIAEGATLNFTVSATDGDGTTPTFTTSTLPTNASFVDHGNGTGTFNFVPSFTQAGTYNVTFRASDGSLLDSEVVTITVTDAGNQPPVLAAIGNKSVTEGNTLTFTVSATDADGTSPVLTTSSLPPNALFTDNGNGTGSFNFTPAYNQAGIYNITFRASDGVAVDTEIVAITVNDAGNQPPVLAAIGPKSVAEGATLSFTVTATDPDGTFPTLTTSVLPTNASFTDHGDGTGAFTFIPGFTQAGSYNVTFRASDGTAIDSEVVAITVTDAGNQPPVLAAIGPKSVTEANTLSFTVTASDPDGTTPSLNTSTLPANASFVDHANGTGTFTFTPSYAQAGNYNITFRASDGSLVDSEVVAITVSDAGNQKPVLAAIGNQATNEGQALTFGVSASDPDGTTPTLTTSTLPANASFVDHANGTGTFTFNPSFSQSGSYNVIFYASDAGGLKDSQIVQIVVTNVNQAPVLASIGPLSTTEGVPLNVLVSAADPDGTTPAFTTTVLPAHATFTDYGDGTGLFSFTPDFNQAGSYNVTFRASDGSLVDSETVTITVNDAGNQTPTLAAIGSKTVAEGNTLSVDVSGSDPDGGPVTLTASPLPTNASFVDHANGTGTFTFSPDFTQAGQYNVIFRVTDTSGLFATETVQITVTSVNRPPVLATIGAKSVTEGQPLDFTVSAADPDSVVPVLSTSPLPFGASFVDNHNGTASFAWIPNFVQSGSYTVTFYATDGATPTDIDSEVVALTVLEAGNQKPVIATIGAKSVTEGQTLTFQVTATDPDGTTPALTTSTLPANATFTDAGNGSGSLTFTPSFSQSGNYSVTFYASDGILLDSQIVAVTVNEAGNISPIIAAVPDTSVAEGGTLVLTISATDPDGGTAHPSLSVTTRLKHYTFVDHGDGTATFTYSPDYYDAGADSVRFFATDFVSAPAVELSVITTTDVNRAPVFATTTSPKGVAVGDSLIFTVATSDSTDPLWPRRLYLSSLGLPPGATFNDNGNSTGTFRWRPDSTQLGTYNVTFLVVDQGVPQLSATLPMQVKVIPTNHPPTLNLAALEARSLTEGQTLNISVVGTDPDGIPPTLLADGLPTNATLVTTGPGTATFTFTPDFMQGGNVGRSKLYTVTIKATDGFLTAKSIVTVQVYDAGNQKPMFDSLPSPSVVEGDSLFARVRAHDPDGGSVTLKFVRSTMPANATFVDSGNGLGLITFRPYYNQAGVYQIQIVANDGTFDDTATVTITVLEAGNQPPILSPIGNIASKEMRTIADTIRATDPDGDFPKLSTSALPTGATFTDLNNGKGYFLWQPINNQAGTYEITFRCEDRTVAGLFDSETVTITVADSNIVPNFDDPLPQAQNVYEGDSVKVTVYASDPDLDFPVMKATSGLITDTLFANMHFVDSGNGVGVLTFKPSYTQGGTSSTPYLVTFYCIDAKDPSLYQSQSTRLTVMNRNAPPVLVFPSTGGKGPYTIAELQNVTFVVRVTDVDGTKDTVIASNMPAGATFTWVPLASGYNFSWTPDATQSGSYWVHFTARDPQNATTVDSVSITVTNIANMRSTFTATLPDTTNSVAGMTIQLVLRAQDPEREHITIQATPLLPHAAFVDSGNGVGVYSYAADTSEVGQQHTVTFVASDPQGASDTTITTLRVVAFLRGDLDQNGKYTIMDLANLIDYLLRSGPKPLSMTTADVNADGIINLVDLTYLIRFMYSNGPRPPQ